MILTPSFGSTLTLKIPCSTKPAPLFCGFFVRTRQHCLFPVLAVVFPHPLQNRVPRVQVLLPLPKTALLLLQWRCFLSLGGTSWQRGTAAPRAVRVVGACSPVGCVQARPRRQPRQVPLPLPKSRRKHWVFAGFLFACVARLCGSLWFGFLVHLPVHTCRTPLQHPKRTRFRPFWPKPGAFLCFPPFWTCKILGPVFVHPVA